MKEWHSEHHANLSPFSQRWMESSNSYEWKVSLQVTLDFFFFVDVYVAVFSTCLKLRIQKAIDVPRPLANDLWVFLFQKIDAECVK